MYHLLQIVCQSLYVTFCTYVMHSLKHQSLLAYCEKVNPDYTLPHSFLLLRNNY